eukprot:1030918-Pelagomonas_calceolata.AAC.1
METHLLKRAVSPLSGGKNGEARGRRLHWTSLNGGKNGEARDRWLHWTSLNGGKNGGARIRWLHWTTYGRMCCNSSGTCHINWYKAILRLESALQTLWISGPVTWRTGGNLPLVNTTHAMSGLALGKGPLTSELVGIHQNPPSHPRELNKKTFIHHNWCAFLIKNACVTYFSYTLSKPCHVKSWLLLNLDYLGAPMCWSQICLASLTFLAPIGYSMHAEMPGFKKCKRLPSDKQHISKNPSTPHINNLEEMFVPSQSNLTLMLKIPDWRTWAYTDGSCHIQNGKQGIGAGVYCPLTDNIKFVEPNGLPTPF